MNTRKKHAAALIDGRADKSMIHELEKYADAVLLLPKLPALSEPVSAHADMLIWRCGKTVLTYADYRALSPDIFTALRSLGYEIREITASPSQKYPGDVALNCALLGKNIIANTKYCASEIRILADKNGLTLLHTNQGYAKCSTAIVSNNAIITSDTSVAAVAAENGIDALAVSIGGVELSPYEYGFIGGASGSDENNVFFCGNVDLHPDALRIREFCKKHQKDVVCLSDAPLADVGTVMFFD